MRYRIRRAKTWHCCVAPLVPRLPSHWSHFRRNPPPSSGVLDCTSSSSFLMFWCVFLKGLCIWEKKSIYFNRYLIFIFYNKLPETGGFFVFIRSQILGEPMLKMYIWMSGKKNVSCLTLPFFMYKEKKRCKRWSWRDRDVFTTSFTLRKELLHLCQIAWGCAWACTPEFI